MIKKSLIAATALFTAVGCSAGDAPAQKLETQPEKVLIAYFSWSSSGNTRYVAEQIQKTTGGTLFEIKPAKPYPTDYRECCDYAKPECSNGIKPPLATKVENFDSYDVIFVGSPNWWGTMAPPVLTFVSEHNLSGKTLIPFFTNGGGGMQNCEKNMKKAAAKAKLLPAKTFSGYSVRKENETIAAWVKSLLTITKP